MGRLSKLALLALAFAALASCSKENGATGPFASLEVCLDMGTISPESKALGIDEDSADDKTIDRLDIFIFTKKSSSYKYSEHITLFPGDIVNNRFILQYPQGTRHRYIFVTNMDEKSADSYATKASKYSMTFLPRYAYCSLSKGNYSSHRLPIIGSAEVRYGTVKEVVVKMYRQQYRIDVGDITVTNKEFLSKDVFLKRIALINSYNAMAFLTLNFSSYSFNTPELLFGETSDYSENPIFGGITTGYSMAGADAYGDNELPSETFTDVCGNNENFFLNNNWKKDEGVLSIDASGDLLNATVETFDGNGVQLCSSTDAALSHTYALDKCFYGLPGYIRDDNTSSLSTYDGQDLEPKLVVELSVDGETVFYPLYIRIPQPNTIYKVGNILLESEGSSYSNFIIDPTKAGRSVPRQDLEAIPVTYKYR